MRRAGRLKSKIVATAMAVTVLGASGVVLSAGAWANQAMTATTWVNVRSGPGTSYKVVGTLNPAQAVTSSTSQGGWYKITAPSGLTGWVYQTYLRASGGSAASSGSGATSSTTAAGTARAISAVNIRSAAGTASTVVGTLAKGASIPVTGKTSGGWTEVVYNGANRWISTNYLTTGSVSTSPVTGQLRTTAELYLRTGGSLSSAPDGLLPANSIVDTTGKTTADYTEIIYRGANRWIATRYTAAVSSGPTSPSVPQATGSATVTVGSLYIRATSAADGAVVATVYRGATLQTTGVTDGDRLQVIYQGAVRWVFKAYTSVGGANNAVDPGTSAPIPSGLTTSGIAQLNSNAKSVFNHVVANYPQIRTIYGWRASSNWSSDHPNGRAVDVMIANWSSQSSIDLGWTIAKDFAANASQHNVSYIIFRQQQFNTAYPARGWRMMEDRGSATENHMDHVHVSVKP